MSLGISWNARAQCIPGHALLCHALFKKKGLPNGQAKPSSRGEHRLDQKWWI